MDTSSISMTDQACQRPLSEAALAALFQRSGWKLLPATAALHGDLLQEWIDADRDHTGQQATDWLRLEKGRGCNIAFDKQGPLLLLRASNALRLDMEFAPGAERRIAMALPTGLIYVAGQARERGFHELLTESKSPKLIRLLQRLGWRNSPTEFLYGL